VLSSHGGAVGEPLCAACASDGGYRLMGVSCSVEPPGGFLAVIGDLINLRITPTQKGPAMQGPLYLYFIADISS
jgi:hypothetical protein